MKFAYLDEIVNPRENTQREAIPSNVSVGITNNAVDREDVTMMPIREDLNNNVVDTDLYENFNDKQVKKNYINDAINTLNQREKTIIRLRKFKEKSITLDELGKMLKISKERVRQIETKALEKLRKAILEISQQDKEFFI